jgi:sugar-1,4-lactone oxidase-like protein
LIYEEVIKKQLAYFCILQQTYFLMQSKKHYTFFNWAQNESCKAQQYFQPETEEEILALLQQCTAEKKHIRIVGSGHSWSAICLSNEYLLNLDNYQKVIHLDASKKQITVQAGIKIWQLNEYLYQQGFSLHNLGSISAQSIAGAINTATHGSGIRHTILAGQVASLKLLTPTGKILFLDKEKDEPQFNLALVGLGALGIISEVTLNITERYHLHEQAELIDFNETCDNVLKWIHEHDHLKLWWFPHTDKIMVYKYNRTQAPVNDPPIRQFIIDKVLAKVAFTFIIWLGNIYFKLRPILNRFISSVFLNTINRVEKSHTVFNVTMPPLHRETEWAFDIQHTPQLLKEYRNMIIEKGHTINFVQEIRFVKGDNFALSPCYLRDSIYVGAYHACNKDWQPLFNNFENIAMKYNGRPHWGKEFTFNKNYLQQQYQQLNEFIALQKTLDPNGVMLNDFMKKVF